MKENQKEKDFLISCAQSGAADFLYNKQSRPSRWMSKEEKDLWFEGYTKAKEACTR